MVLHRPVELAGVIGMWPLLRIRRSRPSWNRKEPCGKS